MVSHPPAQTGFFKPTGCITCCNRLVFEIRISFRILFRKICHKKQENRSLASTKGLGIVSFFEYLAFFAVMKRNSPCLCWI
jgi:hypothetical protein